MHQESHCDVLLQHVNEPANEEANIHRERETEMLTILTQWLLTDNQDACRLCITSCAHYILINNSTNNHTNNNNVDNYTTTNNNDDDTNNKMFIYMYIYIYIYIYTHIHTQQVFENMI